MAASLFIMAIQPASVNAASDTEKKIEEANKEIEETQADIEKSQKSVDTIKETKENLDSLADKFDSRLEVASSELSDINSDMQDQQTKINGLTEKLAAAEEELAKIEAELKEAQADLDAKYSAMKKRIQYMYEKGTPSSLDMFMGSSSLGEYFGAKKYIKAIADYDAKTIAEYKKAADNVAAKKEKAEADKLAVEEERAALEAGQAELDELFQDQVLKREEIADLITSASSVISMTDEQLKEAEAVVKTLQKQLDEQNANVENLKKQLEEEKRLQELSDAEKWRDMSDVAISDDDEYLMANIIFCEAGNQPYEGQVAVGAVVMNRVKSSAFPNTIREVIYQKGQFEPVLTGRYAIALAKNEATESCYKAARAAMAGETTVDDCLFFRTPISGINYKYKIAGHIFY